MRGEYFNLNCRRLMYRGSPPHAWRIPNARLFDHRFSRITSTCVENTVLYQSFGASLEDHLHMRGEYSKPPTNSAKRIGSPPHAWRIQ